MITEPPRMAAIVASEVGAGSAYNSAISIFAPMKTNESPPSGTPTS
jgi:hypothetical protein